jgi:hypothetical protein
MHEDMNPDKYRGTQGEIYVKGPRRGYTTIDVLEFLNRRLKWGDLALGYVHALNPTRIRVTKDRITLDGCVGRVTVFVDSDDVIQRITQEVEVALPDDIDNGVMLEGAVKFGREEAKDALGGPLAFANPESIKKVAFSDGETSQEDTALPPVMYGPKETYKIPLRSSEDDTIEKE